MKVYYEKHRDQVKPKMRDHARCRKAQRDASMLALREAVAGMRSAIETFTAALRALDLAPPARLSPYKKYRGLKIHKKKIVHTDRLLGKDWLANEHVKGAGGALKHILGEEPQEEPIAYLQIESKKHGRRYGAMHYDEVAEIYKANHRAYEIIHASRKRKFYLDFDNDVPDDGRPPKEHQRVFEELQAKVISDAERICGPGRAILSGS